MPSGLVGLALLILSAYVALREVWLTGWYLGRRARRVWLTRQRLARMFGHAIDHLLEVTAIRQ